MYSSAPKTILKEKALRPVKIGNKYPGMELKINSISFDYTKIYNEKLAWKRALDIVFGVIGLILFLVLFPAIALGIKLSSNGPVIFKQQRTGFDGNIFDCYKFRSMHTEQSVATNKNKPDITKKNDTRIFKFGKFLRKSNLDEIPQFINVLKGDMSLVGPRPYPVDENRYWKSIFPDFYKRFAVKPGITGLAQATGYRGGTLNLKLMRERLKRDLAYIKKRSLSTDLKLIVLTIQHMVTFRTNAH